MPNGWLCHVFTRVQDVESFLLLHELLLALTAAADACGQEPSEAAWHRGSGVSLWAGPMCSHAGHLRVVQETASSCCPLVGMQVTSSFMERMQDLYFTYIYLRKVMSIFPTKYRATRS